MPDRRFPPRVVWLLAVWASAVASGLSVPAAHPGAAIAAEPTGRLQVTIIRQMASAKPKVRAAAVAKTEQLPPATAARLLAEHGLASPFADLRHASYKALLERGDDQEVCDLLLDRIKIALRKRTAGDVTCGMMGVLLASELEEVRTSISELFDVAVRTPGGGCGLLVDLADELGGQVDDGQVDDLGGMGVEQSGQVAARDGQVDATSWRADETALATLARFAKLPVFEHVFAVRRAVVQALTRSRRPEAIHALVEIMGRVGGEVRADIARHLTTISGEPLALDAVRWQSWWRDHRAEFSAAGGAGFPAAFGASSLAGEGSLGAGGRSIALLPPPVYGPLDAAAPMRYYGLPVYAERLVFVIDTSGSMSGQRLDAAKRELLLAIAALPPGVWFNVVVFNGGVASWSDSLAIASPENKVLASAFVLSQFALGATCTYDALVAALDFEVEAIYFLTDGQPCGGSVTDPATIVTLLTRLNHDRRVSINTLGIGVGLPGSVFDVFLHSLAAVNYGDYRRVDQ